MRVVAQRVERATCVVDGEVTGEIGAGLLLFVGVGQDDASGLADDATSGARQDWSPAVALADKVAELRIFRDSEGKSNLSLLETGGSALVISQFTLYADYRKGRRPSFTHAADPEPAEAMVEEFRFALEQRGVKTATGRFGAHMVVSLVNDGPYTIVLDSDVLAGPRGGRHGDRGSIADAPAHVPDRLMGSEGG
jgi:D-tyrosyl-tRNA(Tyr) deacylase